MYMYDFTERVDQEVEIELFWKKFLAQPPSWKTALSDEELLILVCCLNGQSNRNIAKGMECSHQLIDDKLRSIKRKLELFHSIADLHSLSELVRLQELDYQQVKLCNRCHETKYLHEFCRANRTHDGHHTICKDCQSRIAKLNYQEQHS
jgi:superfamily II helicase